MWRDWLLRNKVAAAFALGAVYVAAYALLLLLIEAQDDENERIAALRWENGRLITRLATAASREAERGHGEPGASGGPS